jgi:TPP-dependent pyruvate/acetoin dehydrogenase alpha subunit
VLDEQGVLDRELAQDTLADDQVRDLYGKMILYRTLDEAAFRLQRSGRMVPAAF